MTKACNSLWLLATIMALSCSSIHAALPRWRDTWDEDTWDGKGLDIDNGVRAITRDVDRLLQTDHETNSPTPAPVPSTGPLRLVYNGIWNGEGVLQMSDGTVTIYHLGKPALWTGDKPIPIPGSPPSSEQTSQQSESDAISGAPAPGPQSEALAPQPGASAPSPGASAPKPSSPGPKASAPTIAPVIAPAIAPSPKVASPAISPVADLAPAPAPGPDVTFDKQLLTRRDPRNRKIEYKRDHLGRLSDEPLKETSSELPLGEITIVKDELEKELKGRRMFAH